MKSIRKIKVYRDSGAGVKFLKNYYKYLVVGQWPHDSEADMPKNIRMELVPPSDLTWQDINKGLAWEHIVDWSWNDFEASEIQPKLIKIVGLSNMPDVRHIDSAYKWGSRIFLTSDKDDIGGLHRQQLETLCGFKIFVVPEESQEVTKYIERLLDI